MTSDSAGATRTPGPAGSLFVSEMALSPVIAAIAMLVPLAAHWGAYKYLPAVVWLVIFAQCLVTFRWRGLWFLLGAPLAFVAIEAFLVGAPPVAKVEAQAVVSGDGSSKPAKPGETNTTSNNSSTGSPLITHNSDGTITVQKQRPNGTNQTGQETGLIIPPQVVAPTISTPTKK